MAPMDLRSFLTPNLPVVKCVVVGDGGVGKTTMLQRYVNGHFLNEYVPTCFDNYKVTMDIDDRTYNIDLVDTAGQETYDRLRTLSYFNTDVFVVCFSVACHDSFVNVRQRWIPELRDYKPGIPILLVGTQTDLRGEPGFEGVSRAQGKKLARKTGAVAYMECSALTGEGLAGVFERAVVTAVCPAKKKRFWGGLRKLFAKRQR